MPRPSSSSISSRVIPVGDVSNSISGTSSSARMRFRFVELEGEVEAVLFLRVVPVTDCRRVAVDRVPADWAAVDPVVLARVDADRGVAARTAVDRVAVRCVASAAGRRVPCLWGAARPAAAVAAAARPPERTPFVGVSSGAVPPVFLARVVVATLGLRVVFRAAAFVVAF